MNGNAPDFISCECEICGGRFEIDRSAITPGETRAISCPHCNQQTTVRAPNNPPKKPPTAVAPPVPLPTLATHSRTKSGSGFNVLLAVALSVAGAGLFVVGGALVL